MINKHTFLFVLFISLSSFGQTYIKGNAIPALVLIPNIGVETSIGKKATFQVDVLASFWKSVNGKPFQFLMITPEYRYYFKEKFNGFYSGAHIGGSTFDIRKWDHKDENIHQKGLGFFVGGTIGYQKKISKKFLLDFFIGGGFHQGYYKAYSLETGERVDLATNYNKSGERIPYRGGIMICYKLK